MGRAASFCDHHLLLPKLLYFMLNALCYSTYTFTAKYFKDVWGIADHHFGYMVGLCALSFTGSLLWTMIADKMRRHKLILVLTTIGCTGSFMLLRTGLFMTAERSTKLIFVSLCYGLSNFFTSALFPLLDYQVFAMLTADARFSKEIFGRQRLFGTLGQSAITLLSGYTITAYGFDAMFLNLLVSCGAFLFLISIGLKNASVAEKEQSADKRSTKLVEKMSFKRATRSLLLSPDFFFFLLIILIAGMTRGMAGNYLPQYFDSVMHLSPWQTSVMLQTRIITEVAVFFLGKEFLQLFGVKWMLFTAQLAGLLRVLAYAVLPTGEPWALLSLVIELLKGINSGCLISAGVRYVHDVAPAGAEATAQGFFSGVHSHLANAASGFLGGLILQLHESNPPAYRELFRYTAVLATVGLVLFSLRQLLPSPVHSVP